MSKYDELSEIIDKDDAESFQKYLDQGLTIGNEWEDKVAFEEALGVHESAEVFPYVRDKSKPSLASVLQNAPPHYGFNSTHEA